MVAQLVEDTTSSQEVMGAISALAAFSLLGCVGVSTM